MFLPDRLSYQGKCLRLAAAVPTGQLVMSGLLLFNLLITGKKVEPEKVEDLGEVQGIKQNPGAQ